MRCRNGKSKSADSLVLVASMGLWLVSEAMTVCSEVKCATSSRGVLVPQLGPRKESSFTVNNIIIWLPFSRADRKRKVDLSIMLIFLMSFLCSTYKYVFDLKVYSQLWWWWIIKRGTRRMVKSAIRRWLEVWLTGWCMFGSLLACVASVYQFIMHVFKPEAWCLLSEVGWCGGPRNYSGSPSQFYNILVSSPVPFGFWSYWDLVGVGPMPMWFWD